MLKHLPRLALRLLLAVAGVVVGTLIAFAFGTRIVEVLLVPVRSAIANGAHTLVYTSAIEPMMLAVIKGPLYGGVFLAASWVLWQVWLLLAPEPHRRERRVALPVVALATALFYGGAALAWGVVLPRTLPGMLAVAVGTARPVMTVDAALAAVVKSMVGFGLAFELPLVVALVVVIARGSTRGGAAPAQPGPPPLRPPSA